MSAGEAMPKSALNGRGAYLHLPLKVAKDPSGDIGIEGSDGELLCWSGFESYPIVRAVNNFDIMLAALRRIEREHCSCAGPQSDGHHLTEDCAAFIAGAAVAKAEGR